jgi:hypothetical protein
MEKEMEVEYPVDHFGGKHWLCLYCARQLLDKLIQVVNHDDFANAFCTVFATLTIARLTQANDQQ